MRDWRGRKRQESIPNSNSILILFTFYSYSIHSLFTFYSHSVHILFTFYSHSIQVLLKFDWNYILFFSNSDFNSNSIPCLLQFYSNTIPSLFQFYSNSIPMLFQCYSNATPFLSYSLFAFHLHFILFLKALVCDHVQVAHTHCTSRFKPTPYTHVYFVSLHFRIHSKAVMIVEIQAQAPKTRYRISSYSFRGNYSFLDLEIQRSQYIRPKVTVHKCGETIQGRKLFKGGNYMRKYGKSCIAWKYWGENIGKQIENPYFLTILLSISLNKLPWTETRLANRGLKTRLVAPLFPSNGK